MDIVRTKDAVRRAVASERAEGNRIGLVPTMGSFHEGHLSLMRLCKERAGFTVVSLFVNPIQFGPGEDLGSYPRDEDRDAELASGAGVDLLFVPQAREMYAPGSSTYVEETGLGQVTHPHLVEVGVDKRQFERRAALTVAVCLKFTAHVTGGTIYKREQFLFYFLQQTADCNASVPQ